MCWFRGRARKLIPASIKVDVSDVARNFASMGRLLRVEFVSHLTNFGHTCWMQNGRQQTTIKEDSPTSEAPLYRLDVEVLPPLGALGEGKSTAGARVAPIAAAEFEQPEEGSKVEMASLVQDMGLNGQKGICLGRAPDVERWLVAFPGGRRANVNTSMLAAKRVLAPPPRGIALRRMLFARWPRRS